MSTRNEMQRNRKVSITIVYVITKSCQSRTDWGKLPFTQCVTQTPFDDHKVTVNIDATMDTPIPRVTRTAQRADQCRLWTLRKAELRLLIWLPVRSRNCFDTRKSLADLSRALQHTRRSQIQGSADRHRRHEILLNGRRERKMDASQHSYVRKMETYMCDGYNMAALSAEAGNSSVARTRYLDLHSWRYGEWS